MAGIVTRVGRKKNTQVALNTRRYWTEVVKAFLKLQSSGVVFGKADSEHELFTKKAFLPIP
jgi:hypothetical protein